MLYLIKVVRLCDGIHYKDSNNLMLYVTILGSSIHTLIASSLHLRVCHSLLLVKDIYVHILAIMLPSLYYIESSI